MYNSDARASSFSSFGCCKTVWKGFWVGPFSSLGSNRWEIHNSIARASSFSSFGNISSNSSSIIRTAKRSSIILMQEMNCHLKHLRARINNWYTQLQELHFLTIWVIALAELPDFVLSILLTFLTDHVSFSLTSAAAIVNAQDASTALFGIVGAILLDGYLTGYGMIFCSSLFYSVGLFLLHVAADTAHTIGGKDITVRCLLAIGLFLIAVGKSSLTDSAIALSGKQAPISIIEYFFKFAILITAFVCDAKFGILELRRQFLLPSILMCLVTVVSVLYVKAKSFEKPIVERRYPLKYALRVYTAAFMKRHLPSPQDHSKLYEENPEHPLEPTKRKRCLMKAAIRETPRPEVEREKWLRTITEVEESKRLLHMVPICMAFLSYGLIYSIGDTFFLGQADQMDTTIGGEDGREIPFQAFSILASLSTMAIKPLYKVFMWKRLRGSAKTYAPAIQYAMGMVLSTLCCVIASWVALETLAEPSEISAFWLIPQFVLFGAMDGLAGDGIKEFFTGELPGSMKRYDSVFAEGIVGVGTLCTIVLVLVTNAATPWFSEENTRLDRFYHIITVIAISIFFGYCYAAVRYYCQDEQEAQLEDESQQEDGEQASHGETEQVPKADFI